MVILEIHVINGKNAGKRGWTTQAKASLGWYIKIKRAEDNDIGGTWHIYLLRQKMTHDNDSLIRQSTINNAADRCWVWTRTRSIVHVWPVATRAIAARAILHCLVTRPMHWVLTRSIVWRTRTIVRLSSWHISSIICLNVNTENLALCNHLQTDKQTVIIIKLTTLYLEMDNCNN